MLLVLSVLCLHSQAQSEPDPYGFNKRGFVLGANGQKCWYKQIYEIDGKYFLAQSNQFMTNTDVRTMTFDDPGCMISKGLENEQDMGDIIEDINKKMIAGLITKWWKGSYTHKDAEFDIDNLRTPAMFQSKGQCIQSKKYPIIAIAIDYIIESDSIAKVVYSPAVGGCDYQQ